MFLHTFQPDSILLDLGFVQVHWYGFLITLGAVLGFFVFYKLAKKSGIDKNKIFDLIFWLVIWSIIGGRLYHVLSEINYYIQNPLEIFYIWNGGLGIYGVIIAGVLVVYINVRRRFLNLRLQKTLLKGAGKDTSAQHSGSFLILDLLAPAIALAQAIGRWGNYFNQELYGLPSKLPWSIPIALENRLAGFEGFEFFHPVFLYESIFCLVLFIILLCLVYRGRDEALPRLYKHGFIFLLYLFFYSTWRFFIEFLRIDPQPVLLNLRLGQWVSLILIIFSIIFYFNSPIRLRLKH